MRISAFDTVKFVLIPGHAETLENLSEAASNLSGYAIAIETQCARNNLYIGIAFTALALTTAALSHENSISKQYALAAISGLGTGLASFAALRLYKIASCFQDIAMRSNTHS